MGKQRYLFWCDGEQDRSQSLHSSEETSNDRGAKGGRKVKSQFEDLLPQGAARVDESPKQAAGVRLSEASQEIWTRGMLETLARGIKGGVWFSLIDKVWNPEHLKLGAKEVIRNKGAAGIDHRSWEQLKSGLDAEVETVSVQLREGRFRAKPVKRVWIEKLGTTELRPLGIPTVRDRMVQATIRAVIEPIFEREFAEHSYGFRIGRNAQMAIARVEELLKQGLYWVVDADFKSYFDSIPQEQLMKAIRERIAGWEMTRYADDFIVQCKTREEAEKVLGEIREWVEKAGLTLHPTKTRILNASEPGGFDFLGWHFERGRKWPREKSLSRFKETLRSETPRNSGQSMERILGRLNRRLKGWINYFKGGVAYVYKTLDKWIRGRLRSILRRRDKRKGRGRGRDHNRYPNKFFEDRGLISLYALDCEKRTSPA